MANFRRLGTDFSEGIRAPHYTNGRLLTAEDLQQEQQAQLEKQAQLGQAAGYGIVEGFEVAAAANNSALRITAGLGLNRKGHVIRLSADSVTLPVQPVSEEEGEIRRSGRFEACSGDEADPGSAVTAGAYLLTVAPLAQLEGSVPRKACDGTGTTTCANQWEVEGVEFKVIRLDNYKPPSGSRSNRNRNLLAHWFYGSERIMTLMRDPLQFPADYTGFGRIAASDFDACDLPLAVFYWANSRIAFVDAWAVRRRLVHPYPATAWGANIGDQRQAEGQARFLQFQSQIADLQTQFGDKTNTIRAVERFGYLPPVGILPINPFELLVADVFEQILDDKQAAEMEERGLSQAQVLERVRAAVLGSLGSANAFNLERFFGDLLPKQYQIVHEDLVHDRLQQSWVQPPILLPPPATGQGYFELALADGTRFAVDSNNFDTILGTIKKKFGGSVYSRQIAELAGAAGAGANLASGAEALVPATENLAFAGALVRHLAAFREPREIFEPAQGEDEETEPLVDILVVDELLDPYRNRLAEEMDGRIDDAIAALSSSGNVLVGSNRYRTVNQAVGNAFTLNQFLWQAANFGTVGIDALIGLIGRASAPIFYVVFARRRAPARARPLRL